MCSPILSIIPAAPLLLEDFPLPRQEQPSVKLDLPILPWGSFALKTCSTSRSAKGSWQCFHWPNSLSAYKAFAGKEQTYLIPDIADHFSSQSTAFSKLLYFGCGTSYHGIARICFF